MTYCEMNKKIYEAICNSTSENITLDKVTAREILNYLSNIEDIRDIEKENARKRMQEFKNELLENVTTMNVTMMKTILDKEV